MQFTKNLQTIESKLNWKIVLLLYLITRLSFLIILTSSWQGESLLCYTADCQSHWRNVDFVVSKKNPYEEWKKAGGYSLPIPLRAEHLPFLYLLMSTFVWLWKSVWSMRLVFFLFDFLNLFLIYRLAKFKNISSLLYVLAPSILRGLLFVEEELFVTFALASIFFFTKKNYSLSTIMLTLVVNIKFFPLFLFPLLLISILKETKKFSIVVKQIFIFIFLTLFLHLFFFPDWLMVYESRITHHTLPGTFGIWRFMPTVYYTLLLVSSFLLFYLFAYLKKIDLKLEYLLGSLLFLSLYPKFSFDHFIFLIPLFLVWTQLKKADLILYLILSLGVGIEFLTLRTIGVFSSSWAEPIAIILLLLFYFIIFNSKWEK